MEYTRVVNEFNTPLNDQYYAGLNKDVIEDIHAAIDEISFIQTLVGHKMREVADVEKDEAGKVIVNVTSPHVLRNIGYFTKAADHYRKNGCYTLLPPNKHPKSPYAQFWNEERRRIKHGQIRDDGEWIPGTLYWYWNYCPIMKTKRVGKGKKSDRVHDFGDPWLGDYLFFHYKDQAEELGQHIEVLKSRGVGASFKMGGLGPRSALFKPRSKTFYVASDMQYLTKDGVITKAWDYLDFLAQHTPFPRLRIVDRQLEKIMGYKDPRTGAEKGMKSMIMGISTKDDPDKIRGKRGDIMFEEYGAYPHIKKAWSVCRESVEDGENVFAQLMGLGTGGTVGADFEGAEDMFYYPESYNIMPLPNVWDRNINGTSNCGFFWGAYLNRANCTDENGMPDITKALKEIFVEFNRIKRTASDPRALTQKRAEKPVTPQDSMMRIDGTIFPVADIRDYLETIMPRIEEFIGPHYIGELFFDQDGKVQWRPSGMSKVIREFPLKDNKHEGAVEIFERPVILNGEAQRNRYVAGIDPYDDDSSTTVSLGSIFILDLYTDRIVAEYTGRPKFANDFYETCRRMLIYYNASANYESDRKGLFQYFDRKNCIYLLSDTLQSLKDIEMVKGNLYGNKAHPYTQEVRTPYGIKKWGDVCVGDKLFDTIGGETTVTSIPFDGETEIYRITLRDGRTIDASGNHLWKVIEWNGCERVLSTEEMLTGYYRNKGKYKEYKYYIPQNQGVEYPRVELPIDPYFLGLMLGDGTICNSRHHKSIFTSSIPDFNEYQKILKLESKTFDDRHHSFSTPNIGIKFRELGLQDTRSRTKFIPDVYKYCERESRLELLRGLMDTDGCIDYGGNSTYCTTSAQLGLDVQELARSLGINCNLVTHQNQNGPVYLVRMYTDVRVFNLERKYSRQKLTKTRSYKTAICGIEKIGNAMSKCVTVDSIDECYLIGDHVITHNSKGTNSGRFINARARRLYADWLLTEAYGAAEDNGTKLNLHKVRSIALLLETMKYNPDGNFDRVSAMGMLMLIREDKQKYIENSKSNEGKFMGGLAFDPYFQKNSRGTLFVDRENAFSDKRGVFENLLDY